MTSYSMLAKGGKEGVVFVAGQPDKSKLVTMVSGPEPEMPERRFQKIAPFESHSGYYMIHPEEVSL